MDSATAYLMAADVILLLHVLFVAFVVIGLAVIGLGCLCACSWIRNPWLRLAHLLAMSVVVVQSWLGLVCPLTRLEMELRLRAEGSIYSDSFIAHWLQVLLYYRVPLWVFGVCYTIIWAVVVASWFWIPPRRFTKSQGCRQR